MDNLRYPLTHKIYDNNIYGLNLKVDGNPFLHNGHMGYNEAEHLVNKDPIVGKIYERLISQLQKFGQLKIEPKKTSIHLGNRFGFAGVYTRQNYINLEVHLNYQLTNKRVTKVEQASANRFHHTFKLTSEKDIDKELLDWLREAYELKK